MTGRPAPAPLLTGGQSLFFDACRGISAQLVLIGHALNVTFPAVFMLATPTGGLAARAGLPYMQNLGVLVFFLISGFLVTGSALRRALDPAWGMPDFLADRFARIFTPLVPALLIICVVDQIMVANAGPSRISDLNSGPADLIVNILMLSGNPGMVVLARATGLDWLASGAFGSADQLWTVMIEWWIYVVFALGFFAAAARRRFGAIGWAIAAGLLAVGLATLAGAATHAPGLLLAWAMGMLACIGRVRLARIPAALLAGVALATLLAALGLLAGNGWAFYAVPSALSLGVAFFATCFALARGSAQASGHAAAGAPSALRRTIAHLSNVSYSLYLVHLSLIVWADMMLGVDFAGPLAFGLMLLLANLAAWLFYLAFERHYHAVRRRMQPLVRRIAGILTPSQGAIAP